MFDQPLNLLDMIGTEYGLANVSYYYMFILYIIINAYLKYLIAIKLKHYFNWKLLVILFNFTKMYDLCKKIVFKNAYCTVIKWKHINTV